MFQCLAIAQEWAEYLMGFGHGKYLHTAMFSLAHTQQSTAIAGHK
jgi:hypothetical protein